MSCGKQSDYAMHLADFYKSFSKLYFLQTITYIVSKQHGEQY